jgi:YfiH family protein
MGGVSTGDFSSLNCGFGSGDDPEVVAENRARITAHFDTASNELFTLRQVHGSTVVFTDDRRSTLDIEGDALVSTTRGAFVGVLTADCVPVLIADGEKGVVGAAHAGWKGAASGVVEALVSSMERSGARRGNMHAAIGPAIQQNAYEVGTEFVDAVTQHAPFDPDFLFVRDGRRAWFDLPGFVRCLCIHSGVSLLDNAALDTYGDESRFFSYRRSLHAGRDDYGRQISVIGLS